MGRIAAHGAWGTVEWAMDARGRCPARQYFNTLGGPEKAKFLALFKALAETGKILNREKFRKLGQKGGKKSGELWEFKNFQERLLGDFRGNRFLIAHGVQKKKDDLRPPDLLRALRILLENDEQEAKAKGQENAGEKPDRL